MPHCSAERTRPVYTPVSPPSPSVPSPPDPPRLSLPVRILACGLAVVLFGAASAVLPKLLRVGDFSSGTPEQGTPDGWERLTFGKIDMETEYDLVTAPGDSTVVLKATSDGGASGLIRRQRIDPTEYPVIRWRWRVSNVLEKGNARTKDGDDYPARIYVTFDHRLGFGGRLKQRAMKAMGYDDIPSRALNYVWASRVDTGHVFPSAYTDWVMMMPLQSGPEKAGTWVVQEQNILEDYRRAFGEDPSVITGVAVMTDTDDTGESATAYYGDITFAQE